MVYAKWGIVISRSWERSRSETYEKLELLWSPIPYISSHEVFKKYFKMMQMQGMAAWWMNKKMENRRVFYLQGYEKFMRKLTPPSWLSPDIFSISEIPIGMLTNDDLWTLWKSWYSDVVANGRFNLSWIDNDLKDDINFPNHLLLTF